MPILPMTRSVAPDIGLAPEGDHRAPKMIIARPKMIIAENDHLRESLDFFLGVFLHNQRLGALKSLIRPKMLIFADFPNTQK